MAWRAGARYEAGAGGRTVRATGISSGEFHALGRELVEMRRLEELRLGETAVLPAEVISQDENGVGWRWFLVLCGGSEEQGGGEKDGSEMACYRGQGIWSDR